MKKSNLLKATCLVLSLCYLTLGQAQDTLQHVVIDTMLQLRYLEDSNSTYIRKIGVNTDGDVVLQSNPQYNYQVDNVSDILNLTVPDKANITVKSSGAKYCVQADSIAGVVTDSCVIIKTNSDNYAILQTRDGGYYIEDFGAIADDGNDDQPAIQKAIDAVLGYEQWSKSSRINVGSGVFNLKKGVVFAEKTGVEYDMVTFTLSGNISCYSNDQNIGKTTVFELDSATFCIAVQRARNCVIENIMFKGGATYTSNFTNIIEWEDDDWGENAGARINRYSPSCAIAIDPFDYSISAVNQYPYFSNYYTNYGAGGSSMLTIRGCSFNSHYTAIANNPSVVIQNGDNIRAENCHVKYCHTFWACGQTQSRSNSINNVYGLYLHTFIDGITIGDKLGTAPTVSNVNLAGGLKQLLKISSSSFTPIRISDSYFEGIWSLGFVRGANSTTFDKCQIKFRLPSSDAFMPQYQLWVSLGVTFRDCSIEYFNSGATKMPFVFRAKQVLLSGGYIEGGVVGSEGWTAGNITGIFNVKYENVYLQSFSKVTGVRNAGLAFINTEGEILYGGDEIDIGDFTFKNNEGVYKVYYTESITSLDIDSTAKTVSFVTALNSGQYQLGDNIFTNKATYLDSVDMAGDLTAVKWIKTYLGFVSNIDGDTITVSGFPYGFSVTASTALYVAKYPRFLPPIFGDFVSGNDTIKNVSSFSTASYPATGWKLYNDEIPIGAYVTAVNSSSGYIVMSAPAKSTKTSSFFENAPYEQTVHRTSTTWPPPSGEKMPYKKGAIIYLKTPAASVYGYVCTQGGITDTSNPPTFGALTY